MTARMDGHRSRAYLLSMHGRWTLALALAPLLCACTPRSGPTPATSPIVSATRGLSSLCVTARVSDPPIRALRAAWQPPPGAA